MTHRSPIHEHRTRAQLRAALFLGPWAAIVRAEPAQPILTLTARNVTTHSQIPPHVDYGVSLTLQAVPLLDLLAGLPLERFDRLEASAKDGFVAQIPLALIEAGKRGGSVAWIAVEEPNHPWLTLPAKDVSAGPLYLIWLSRTVPLSNEQWPYMLEKLTAVQSPNFAGRSLK